MPIAEILVLLSFGVIGGGLKFIDEAFDESAFSRKLAFAMAALVTIVWMGISIYDATSATLLFAILAGVFLSGKVDNPAFKMGAAALLPLLFLSGRFNLLLFLPLALAGVLDEKGNDYVDSRKANRAVRFFFLHRFSMKLGVFALCFWSYLPWLYLFTFMSFDIAYDLVGVLSRQGIKLETTVLFCKNLALPEKRISFVRKFKLNGIVISS